MELVEIQSELFKAVDKENWQIARRLMIKLKRKSRTLSYAQFRRFSSLKIITDTKKSQADFFGN